MLPYMLRSKRHIGLTWVKAIKILNAHLYVKKQTTYWLNLGESFQNLEIARYTVFCEIRIWET